MNVSRLEREEIARLRRISGYCTAPGYILGGKSQSGEEIFQGLLKTVYENYSKELMQNYKEGKITTEQLFRVVRTKLSPLVEAMKS